MALDYDFDYYIFSFEYSQNPNKEFLPNKNDKIYLEYCELLMQAKEYGMGYRIEFENVLYCVPTPLVKLDNLNNYHSDIQSSIRWKNGKEFYFLHNVNFPKELWSKIVNRELSFKEISEIQNIEQRTQAMKYCPPREFLENKGKLLDKSIRGNELWIVPQSADIFNKDAYFLLYKDISTERIYMSGIDPEIGKEKNADKAMSWKFQITLNKYQYLSEES